MKLRGRQVRALGTALLILVATLWWWSHLVRPPRAGPCVEVARAPRLHPDYTDLVIPPNIAPLNFVVAEPGRRHLARLSDDRHERIDLAGHGAAVEVPIGEWRRLLAANHGRDLRLDVWVQDAGRRWSHFAPTRLHVAPEPIDGFLAYRLFRPYFNTTGPLQLCQRDLSSFDETVVMRREEIGGRCLNCHSFHDRQPDSFLFHTRPEHGDPAMVLVEDGKPRAVDTRVGGSGSPAGYTSWHPNGRLIAFSRNRILQFFPQAGSQARDALDVNSSLAVYSLTTGQTTAPAVLNPPGRLPTFPCWSPDGRWLYFASAPRLWAADAFMPIEPQKRLRYDLMRASYDPDTEAWGTPETVVAAADTGQSALEPRISPDGHFLLFCLCPSGSFPVFQERTDLYLLDLRQPGARPVPLEATTPSRRDSWHSWSSNSRWIVCSSKRDNGLLARPYLRYVDPAGAASKPFVLPQRDPRYYDRCLSTYNVPELVSGRIRIDHASLVQAARGPARTSGGTARTVRPPVAPDAGGATEG